MTFVLKWYKLKLSSSVRIDGGTLFHKFAALTRKVLLPLHVFELHLGTINVLEVWLLVMWLCILARILESGVTLVQE